MPPRQKRDKTPRNYGLPPRINNESLRAIHEAWISSTNGLTIPFINSVQRAYATGDWKRVGQAFDQIFREETIRLSIQKRIDAFLSLPFNIIAASEEERDVEFANFIADNYSNIFPQQSIEYLFSQRLLLNTCIGTLSWENGIPTLWNVHPQNLWCNPTNLQWNVFTRDEGRILVDLTPGGKNFSEAVENAKKNGNLSQIKGNPSFVFYSSWHPGSYNAPLVSLLLPAYQALLTRIHWLEAMSANSAPTVIVRVPETAEEETINRFVDQMLRNIQNRLIVLKNGKPSLDDSPWDVEFKSTTENANPTLFKDFLDDYRRQVIVAFLHANTSTEIAEGGANRAAASVHDNVEFKLTIADYKWFNELVCSQVFQPMAEKFNPFNPPGIPSIEPDLSSFEDPGVKIDLYQKLIILNKLALDSGLKITNFSEILSQHGLKLESINQTNENKTISDQTESKSILSTFNTNNE